MPFVAINCGALPESLIESELFGHRKGSFTGADEHRVGLFEVANGGTLFLDEIGELPKAMQAKLLRVLESGEIRRVGENESLTVDVRVVCATHRDLEEMVAKGEFREDLMFRINTFEIQLPPLRERIEDIRPAGPAFVGRVRGRTSGPTTKCFRPRRWSCLRPHNWPGNVRELANVIEHAAILCDTLPITVEHLPDRLTFEASTAAAVQRRRPPDAARNRNASHPPGPRPQRRQQAEGGRRTRHQPEDALQQAESGGGIGADGVIVGVSGKALAAGRMLCRDQNNRRLAPCRSQTVAPATSRLRFRASAAHFVAALNAAVICRRTR